MNYSVSATVGGLSFSHSCFARDETDAIVASFNAFDIPCRRCPIGIEFRECDGYDIDLTKVRVKAQDLQSTGLTYRK